MSLDRELKALRSSWIWKITAPLLWLYGLVVRKSYCPTIPHILVIQSGNTDRTVEAVRILTEKFHPESAITYLVDDRRTAPPDESIPNLEKKVVLKSGVLNAIVHLWEERRVKHDIVAVMFSREQGYLKHKIMAFLFRKRALLIFNENNDCFYFNIRQLLGDLRWRLKERRVRSRNVYLLKEGIKVVRNEGIVSFLVKVKRRLVPARPSRPLYQQRTDIKPFSLPYFSAPRVSIVVPVYNKSLYTYNCLLSMAENPDNVPFEVIVVDNASTDNTAEVIPLIRNVRVIRNEENLGFVDACNIGAEASKGDLIFFLNNDTMVTPRWLSSLVKVFDARHDCGAAGSKLIYPYGRLQEAGGIIWNDASGWNYGKFDDPDKPEYNYVREMDYCSGAALMVRKQLFEKIGSFDRRYVPAYFEDTDLCFSVRKFGYKVLYQPASVIVHFEGISAGTSTASGMKRFQEVNRPKFVEKWSEELSYQYRKGENVFLARDRNRNKRILIIDHYVPMYDKDAGSFFMYSLLRALAGFGYRVVFWPDNLFPHEPYTADVQQMGVEVIYGAANFKNFMKKNGEFFDYALLTRTHISINYIGTIRKYISKLIYFAPDLEFLREKRRMEMENESQKNLKKIKDREFYLLRNSDVIGIHSPVEKELILTELPDAKVSHVPLPIAKITATSTPFEKRNHLLFVGSSHPPSIDAINYFIEGIMPILKEKLPGCKMCVVGGISRDKIKEPHNDNVIFAGFVKDLLPYFEDSRIYVAPLRYGAGIKGKVLEAMSYGLAVVTTSVGAEGIGLTDGENVLIADDAEAFVESIARIYNDKRLWEKISKNGQRYVEKNFSQGIFRDSVRDMMDMLFTTVRGRG